MDTSLLGGPRRNSKATEAVEDETEGARQLFFPSQAQNEIGGGGVRNGMILTSEQEKVDRQRTRHSTPSLQMNGQTVMALQPSRCCHTVGYLAHLIQTFLIPLCRDTVTCLTNMFTDKQPNPNRKQLQHASVFFGKVKVAVNESSRP